MGRQPLPAVELIRVLLPSHVEVEAQVRVYADTEVVIHEEYRRCVLVCVCSVCVIGKSKLHFVRLLLVRVKDDRPPVQKCPQLYPRHRNHPRHVGLKLGLHMCGSAYNCSLRNSEYL